MKMRNEEKEKELEIAHLRKAYMSYVDTNKPRIDAILAKFVVTQSDKLEISRFINQLIGLSESENVALQVQLEIAQKKIESLELELQHKKIIQAQNEVVNAFAKVQELEAWLAQGRNLLGSRSKENE